MKKFFLLIMASMMTVFMMAAGTGDGSTKANAIEFDWDKGITHDGGTLWYRVDLAPLYDEENPSLTLYLTNPSNEVGTSVDVSMQATVAGQSESKDYTIAARQYKTYTANASMLVRMKQTEIFLTLTSNGKIKLSAKVFESADLDETCKDARVLKWNTVTTQNPMYSAWWKVDLTPVKNATKKDAKITLTNTGSKTVNLKIGQSLDCPSSGLTKREFQLAPDKSVEDTIPQAMIKSVQPDELYFGVENVESQVSLLVELVDQPAEPIIPATAAFEPLHVTDTFVIAAGKHYYQISVAEMRDTAKYEPEFTYRNLGAVDAKVSVKMAFEVPAFGTSNTEYELAANGGEEIVVYKKNMLEGLSEDIKFIYLLTECDQDINFYGRFKHVREGKACKTNIDFNWETGHTQEARTTQWYAINVTDARDNLKDIVVHLLNQGTASATVKASMAFSCPYIDVQEITRTIAADGKEVSRRLGYSTYAMLSDTVWIGLETSQDIKFWATTVPAQTKEPDEACLNAVEFNWKDGVLQNAEDTVWYKIGMDSVKTLKNFPTVFVQNLSSTNAVNITAELSLECPDSIENESRKLTIAANGSYSKQLSRNMFENISQDTIYLRIITTEQIKVQIRLTEEAEGASCSSAIPFNWVSGNTQKANEDLWYVVDLRQVMQDGNDLKLHLENRDNEQCKGVIQLSYGCPVDEAPSIQDFTLAGKATKTVTIENSALDMLSDSVIYVNLQGTTGLRFWADTLEVEPFDPISGEGITLTELKWDELYEQKTDTAWYIIPQSEIEKVRNMEEKKKPVAHLINLGAANTIKVEAAFAFPITKKMMTKSQAVKANQHFTDTIPAGTFDQLLKKDSVIIRITRPVGSADFQFKAELVKAFSGNDRKDALPVRLGERLTQSPNTIIWYKVKTADLKKDKDLYNKKLWVSAKNAGAGDAKVTVHVYEGLNSQTDMFEEYGLGDYRERTIKKGQGKSHNVPAQAIYAVGDVELYIQVQTTDSLVFETKFVGEYAAQAVDPEQAKAKLVVPNVDYVIPGDNQAHWYQVCIPYIRNNYKYVHASTLVYELDGTATIEATATLQDEMDCAMPVRKRTINKSGKHYKGEKLLSDLLAKGIKKAVKHDFDITSFQEQFIDSMLHRYVTADSITAYVRIKSDRAIKVRLNMPQTTGDDCLNAMSFDWEHGNVNPKDQHTWYVVALDTTALYQENKSLRLHVDNWSDTASVDATATLYFQCGGEPVAPTISKTIPAGDSLKKDISIDFIKASSPQLMFIEFNSTQTTHIWIEKVDVKRDTVEVDTTFYVCKGATVLGKVIDLDTDWNDTVRDIKDEEKLALYDSITYIHAIVLREPKVYDFSSQVNIKRNAPLDLTAADTWVKAQYAADDTKLIQNVTDIKWQYAVYSNPTYIDIDLANPPTLAAERINVKYIATTECENTVDTLHMNIARDTLEKDTCNFFFWDETDSLYILPTTANPDSAIYPGGAAWGDSIIYLSLALTNPANMDLLAIAKYGNRLLLINRWDFAKNGFETEPLYTTGGDVVVEWFNANDPEHPVAEGYSYNNADGSPLVGTFYAVITVKGDGPCGLYGRTIDLVCGPVAAGLAPALAPSIAMPGEDIKVINLDPEKETIIRIFTTEGLLQHTYNVRGQETFTIKAANDHGFYLVELLSGEEKSTLRYIVK